MTRIPLSYYCLFLRTDRPLLDILVVSRTIFFRQNTLRLSWFIAVYFIYSLPRYLNKHFSSFISYGTGSLFASLYLLFHNKDLCRGYGKESWQLSFIMCRSPLENLTMENTDGKYSLSEYMNPLNMANSRLLKYRHFKISRVL